MPDDINDAISEATDAAVKEVGGEKEEEVVQAEEVTPDEGATEEAAAEPETEAKETPAEDEEEEEPLGLSAAQLEAINKDPNLQAVYKSMQRGFTKKTQSLAETRKEFEEARNMVEYIRANPDEAVRQMAEMRGYVVAKRDSGEARNDEIQGAASDAVEALMEKYSKQLGPESTKLLLPMMQEVARTVAEQALRPVAEQTQFLDRAAKERGISAAVHEFGSYVKEQGGEWTEKIQSDMAEMMDRVIPGDDTTIHDYLGMLYDATTAKNARSAAVKRELARLRKAQSEAEPTRAVRPAPRTEQTITSDMSEKDAISLAVAQAEREARAS